jgi:hypothetical protein
MEPFGFQAPPIRFCGTLLATRAIRKKSLSVAEPLQGLGWDFPSLRRLERRCSVLYQIGSMATKYKNGQAARRHGSWTVAAEAATQVLVVHFGSQAGARLLLWTETPLILRADHSRVDCRAVLAHATCLVIPFRC